MASQKQAARPGKPAAGQGGGLAGYLATHKFELSTLLFSLAGLGVSIYMVIEHYTQNAYAGCPQNATFNCAKVTTSPESVILGIPVAVLGLAFYLFMTGINSPWG
ncbi:MAG: vitamin K epoxide reductase family protein, partial [Actinomycetota bacterium]|nr:vitamin K epoxide reductase family protein [Actinomycetota bacterium]